MRVLIYEELKELKGIPFSPKHLIHLEKTGRFPRRIKIGERAVAWVEEEIDAYLADRAAKRDGKPVLQEAA
jgi:prophage regulatory protein